MITETSRQEKEKKIVFFDGICQLCNGFVDFLITRDSRKVLYYAPLQGSTASAVLNRNTSSTLDSVVFVKEGQIFQKSKAVVMILKELPYPWKSLGLVGEYIPRFVADAVYERIAKNRYQWFGQKDSCRLPSAEEKAQFLP